MPNDIERYVVVWTAVLHRTHGSLASVLNCSGYNPVYRGRSLRQMCFFNAGRFLPYTDNHDAVHMRRRLVYQLLRGPRQDVILNIPLDAPKNVTA